MENSFLPPTGLPFASRPRIIRLLLLLSFLFAFSLWFSSRALLTANFLPHWYCLAGNTRLLWTTVLGDLFIGLSYVVISATLVRIVRRARQELPYQGFFWAFGLFIVSCGVTHFMEIPTVWQPVYWLAASAKILTAVSSVGTAIVLLVATQDIIAFARTARDAFSPQDALDSAKDHPGKIDLLVIDVVMPGLRGPELHRQIVQFRPEIRVLFMSGYAEDLPEMRLPQGALFLQKPFRLSALLESLRQLNS